MDHFCDALKRTGQLDYFISLLQLVDPYELRTELMGIPARHRWPWFSQRLSWLLDEFRGTLMEAGQLGLFSNLVRSFNQVELKRELMSYPTEGWWHWFRQGLLCWQTCHSYDFSGLAEARGAVVPFNSAPDFRTLYNESFVGMLDEAAEQGDSMRAGKFFEPLDSMEMPEFFASMVTFAEKFAQFDLLDYTAVALDGKICPDQWTWGVGLLNLGLGIGCFSGGRIEECSQPILKAGKLDQATVETLALQMGMDWLRKQQKPKLAECLAAPFHPVRRNVTFITDRTATLVTMMAYSNCRSAGGMSASGFDCMLRSAAVSLLKLLLVTGRVTFMHKKAVPGQREISSWERAPDRLALKGASEVRVVAAISDGAPMFHLIQWRNLRWSNGLLMQAEANLGNLDEVLATIGAPSYEEFMSHVCRKLSVPVTVGGAADGAAVSAPSRAGRQSRATGPGAI